MLKCLYIAGPQGVQFGDFILSLYCLLGFKTEEPLVLMLCPITGIVLKKKAHVRYILINSNMTPRLTGHFSIFGFVFFVLQSLLGTMES